MDINTDTKTYDVVAGELAEAFLRWNLPKTVCADYCTTYPVASDSPALQRVGTNLLSYTEAKQMMRDLVVPKLMAKDAEVAALRDALQALKDIVDGKRHDPEQIAAIINGALRLG